PPVGFHEYIPGESRHARCSIQTKKGSSCVAPTYRLLDASCTVFWPGKAADSVRLRNSRGTISTSLGVSSPSMKTRHQIHAFGRSGVTLCVLCRHIKQSAPQRSPSEVTM